MTEAERLYVLTDLYGLGKGVWSGVDPDQYVNELRDEWERGK